VAVMSERRTGGADRVNVALFSLAAFLTVFAMLGAQLTHQGPRAKAASVLVRRIYRTTVIERVMPAGTPGKGSVTQSVSGSASAPLPILTTRTS
jgi:hypothetical protein